MPKCIHKLLLPYDSNWGQTSFKDVNMNTINSNIKLHLNSYIWLARLIAEQMLIKKIRGSIIQFGSTYGVVGQITDIYDGTHIKENMIYSAIKGGIINNSRQMSSHYGKFGIRVNTICPGGVLGYVAGQSNKIPEKFLRRYISRTPLKRFAKAKIAYATAFYLLMLHHILPVLLLWWMAAGQLFNENCNNWLWINRTKTL